MKQTGTVGAAAGYRPGRVVAQVRQATMVLVLCSFVSRPETNGSKYRSVDKGCMFYHSGGPLGRVIPLKPMLTKTRHWAGDPTDHLPSDRHTLEPEIETA